MPWPARTRLTSRPTSSASAPAPAGLARLRELPGHPQTWHPRHPEPKAAHPGSTGAPDLPLVTPGIVGVSATLDRPRYHPLSRLRRRRRMPCGSAMPGTTGPVAAGTAVVATNRRERPRPRPAEPPPKGRGEGESSRRCAPDHPRIVPLPRGVVRRLWVSNLGSISIAGRLWMKEGAEVPVTSDDLQWFDAYSGGSQTTSPR